MAVLALATMLPAAGPLSAQQPATGLEAAAAMEKALVEVIAQQEPSVVAIALDRRRQDDGAGPRVPQVDPSGLRQAPPDSPDFIPTDYASGVIIDRRGLVLTNYHALAIDQDDDARIDYYVTTSERKVYRARIKGADPRSDLAVLELMPPAGVDPGSIALRPIELGDASKLRKGQIVVTLGNPYAIARDGQASAGWGIVANLARKAGPGLPREQADGNQRPTIHHYGTLIQTDAKLNLGTSGGPLLSLDGKMVGLTTSIAALVGYEQAAGYAIPVDDAFRRAVEALKQGREVEYGFLGVQPTHLAPVEIHRGGRGVRIEQVIPGTPADRGGLVRGDIVTHVDGQPIHDADGLVLGVGRLEPASSVRLTVLRDERPMEIRSSLTKYRVTGKAIVTRLPPEWRGMRVDYPTAVLPIHQIPDRGVAVAEVQRDSPAWRHGFQRGTIITQVAGRRVDTPADFHQAVAGQRGAVRIVRIEPDGPRAVVVE